MPNFIEQVEQLRREIAAVKSTQRGYKPDNIQWVIHGSGVKYGCLVQVHTDKTTIRIHDGTVDAPYPDYDADHRNPNKIEPLPPLPVNYANVALVGGIGYLNTEQFLTLDNTGWPSATYTRHDIVYLYFGSDGTRAIGIEEGTPTTGSPTDPDIPVGALSIARLIIDDTGIIGVDDTRIFIVEDTGNENLIINGNFKIAQQATKQFNHNHSM